VSDKNTSMADGGDLLRRLRDRQDIQHTISRYSLDDWREGGIKPYIPAMQESTLSREVIEAIWM